jgi:hypothetical protein
VRSWRQRGRAQNSANKLEMFDFRPAPSFETVTQRSILSCLTAASTIFNRNLIYCLLLNVFSLFFCLYFIYALLLMNLCVDSTDFTNKRPKYAFHSTYFVWYTCERCNTRPSSSGLGFPVSTYYFLKLWLGCV